MIFGLPNRDACMVPFINCGTSIYAGFVIFSMLGYIADYKGVEVADVVDEGRKETWMYYIVLESSSFTSIFIWAAI